ncbi:MAG: AAA family ATPase [Pyrinomonadaceae bacterium]
MPTAGRIRDPRTSGDGGTSEGKGGLLMTMGDLVSRLAKVKKTGKGFNALCPAHEDESPSLSISEGSGGKILLKCHTGCSTDSILAAIGFEMRDLFPDNDYAPIVRLNGNGSHTTPKVAKGQKAIDAVYEYKDADGKILYENVRYRPKDFRQRRPDGNGGYIYNLDGIDRVPYRLPEMIGALESGVDEIWFTEGEKDADNSRLLGFTATNFKKWTHSLNAYIEGAHAVLFRDHDRSGVKQANDAATIIAEVASSVKVIDLFDGEPLPDKHGKDVTDWIEIRRGEGLANDDIAEQLAVIVEGSGYWQKDAFSESNVKVTWETKTGSGLEIEFLSTVEARQISWLAKPLIPYGFFTLLDGIEGIGKTYAMLDLAKRLTLGLEMPISGEVHEASNVLFLSVEDSPEYILKPRFEKMQGDCSRLAILRGHFDFSNGGFIDLETTIEAHGIRFVLIDPLFSFTGRADINSTSDVRPITDRLNRIAARYGIAIVGIRHINKSKGFGDARNAGAHSVAWLQGCRSGLMVGHHAEDKSKRGIAQHKLNIAAESNTVYGFEIDADGTFNWTGESDLSISGMLAHKANESNEDRSAIADAIRFLKVQVGNGSKLMADIVADANGEGISKRTLDRAKQRLGIKSTKQGYGQWYWELSNASDA